VPKVQLFGLHIVGHQIRWTVKVFRYWRYHRKVRKLEGALR